MANQLQTACEACASGTQPNEDRSMCHECTTGSYSQFGIECAECVEPNIVNEGKTQCTAPFVCAAGSECMAGDCQDQGDCSPCQVGHAGIEGECSDCSTEQGKVANTLQTACEACQSGTQPSTDFSMCDACDYGTYSQFGIFCESCTEPNVVNDAKTQCTAPFVCAAGTHCSSGDCADQMACVQCDVGYAGIEGICDDCSSEQGKVANTLQTACEACVPGTMPASDQSICEDCLDSPPQYSQFGIECLVCAALVTTITTALSLRTD